MSSPSSILEPGTIAPDFTLETAPGETVTATGLAAAAQSVLAAFKVPARFWIEDAFPTTQSANGNKIQRAKLRELAQQRVAAGG